MGIPFDNCSVKFELLLFAFKVSTFFLSPHPDLNSAAMAKSTNMEAMEATDASTKNV
jgi:uncharacterized metal-binding protein